MLAVFGLGNPPEYAGTRHNIGSYTASLLKKGMKQTGLRKYCDLFASGTLAVIRSKTYMNDSGLAFEEARRALKIAPEDILVICDDFNIPPGKIRYRVSGSSGGHNGLASIIECSGTAVFPRLRIGIGSPPPEVGATEWVLGEFGEDEKNACGKSARAAVDFININRKTGWPAENESFNVEDL